jgi:hypothetical protein
LQRQRFGERHIGIVLNLVRLLAAFAWLACVEIHQHPGGTFSVTQSDWGWSGFFHKPSNSGRDTLPVPWGVHPSFVRVSQKARERKKNFNFSATSL